MGNFTPNQFTQRRSKQRRWWVNPKYWADLVLSSTTRNWPSLGLDGNILKYNISEQEQNLFAPHFFWKCLSCQDWEESESGKMANTGKWVLCICPSLLEELAGKRHDLESKICPVRGMIWNQRVTTNNAVFWGAWIWVVSRMKKVKVTKLKTQARFGERKTTEITLLGRGMIWPTIRGKRIIRYSNSWGRIVIFVFVFGRYFQTEHYLYSYSDDFSKPNSIRIRMIS